MFFHELLLLYPHILTELTDFLVNCLVMVLINSLWVLIDDLDLLGEFRHPQDI